MELKEGVKVRVAFDPKYKIIDGSRKYHGMDFVIARARTIKYGRGGAMRGTYFELEGAEAQDHVPYGFLEENLVPLM